VQSGAYVESQMVSLLVALLVPDVFFFNKKMLMLETFVLFIWRRWLPVIMHQNWPLIKFPF